MTKIFIKDFISNIQKKIYKIPLSLILSVLILLLINFIMIFSTSAITALKVFDDSYYFIRKNSVFLCLGVTAFVFGVILSLRLLKQSISLGLFLSFISFILALFLFFYCLELCYNFYVYILN